VTHLYAETNTPVAEIARTYRIADSSVFRVANRHSRGRPRRRPAPAKTWTSWPKPLSGQHWVGASSCFAQRVCVKG
jgi:hypothetical protein